MPYKLSKQAEEGMIYFNAHSGSYKIHKDGTIDREAMRAFTKGHCHSLAFALNEMTGWPLYGMFLPGRHEDEGGDGTGQHVLVGTPDGQLLDITGKHEESEPGWDFEDYNLYPIDRERVEGWVDEDRYNYIDLEVARPFARKLLQEHYPEVIR